SSKEWIITHAISHHHYPNTSLDYEIQAFEPFVYWLTRSRENSYFIYIYMHIVYFLSSFIAYISMIIEIIKGTRKFHLENTIPIVLFIIQFCIVGDFWMTLKLFMVMQGIGSYTVMLITFPSHRTDNDWYGGDPNGSREYGSFIIQTSKDHSVDTPFIFSMIF